MKLWYQSLTRLDAWPVYNSVLREIIDSVKEPDTVVEVHGLTKVGGVGDQFRYLEFLETYEVLENVHRAMAEGFDAFLIGNIADPGLHQAREFASFPVLGLCESALHIACMMGTRFSMVTINEKFTPRILENVDRCGLKPRMAACDRMTVERLIDLESGFTDDGARDELIAQFKVAAQAGSDAGAEVIIPAGGVVMALLARMDIHQTAGAPILNGITNLIKMGEFAVKMDRIMGGCFTSKRLVYAPPPPSQIDDLRKYYGAGIYPTVKSTKAAK